MAAATYGAYMSVWNMIALSTVVGNPVQSIYPAMNGEKDKIPLYLNKVFSTEENQHRVFTTRPSHTSTFGAGWKPWMRLKENRK